MDKKSEDSFNEYFDRVDLSKNKIFWSGKVSKQIHFTLLSQFKNMPIETVQKKQ